jgi:DNA primase
VRGTASEYCYLWYPSPAAARPPLPLGEGFLDRPALAVAMTAPTVLPPDLLQRITYCYFSQKPYTLSDFVFPYTSRGIHLMKNFAETVRDTVRESADIVRVVSDYVALKGKGSRLSGLCPFHSEKTPSFGVSRDKQFYFCFGCKAGGDVFNFVQQIEHVTFPEAVRIVAEKCGISIPEQTGFVDKKEEERKQIFEIHEKAASYFRKMLKTEEAVMARQVLEKRQIQMAFAERFGLGYAPPSGLLAHLQPRDPLATGLFAKNDRGEVYDRFRHRLMFPIWNERGKTIAFGGRALGEATAKYLNSAESPLYTKSNVLYAMHLARDSAQKAGRMVVVEGYFDCLSLHQAGIENVVASCGTSLTEKQVALMARYVPEVVMNYDPDAAGQNAMRRSIELLLAKDLRVRILKLPGGLDPDDFVRREGGDAYRRLLSGAPYFWQYLMSEARSRFDFEQPAMKAEAVRDVLEQVAKIQDRVEQLEVAKAVAEGFKVPENLVLERLNIAGRRPVLKPVVRPLPPPPARRLSDAERQLIQALLGPEEMGKTVRQVLQPLASQEFWTDAWSWPVLNRLIEGAQGMETILDGNTDAELINEVRAALLEATGALTLDHVYASVQKLFDAHLSKKERGIREELQKCGNDGAPADLLRRLQEIQSERSRVAKTLKARG